MSDEDFSAMLGGDVRRIVSEERETLAKQKDQGVDKQQRREAATLQVPERGASMSAPIEMVDPLDILEFKRPGVQNGVYKNLRMGKYHIDARLDLHRMTVEKARDVVFQFVQDCISNDIRTTLITHGKGEGREQPALLKSCIAHWLPQLDDVLAFHTAQKQHGSYGATYVLLKKSERKKLESKETNRRRS